jgi:hypothetical protein
MSQGDEEELLAISFAGLYDLERGTSFISDVGSIWHMKLTFV